MNTKTMLTDLNSNYQDVYLVPILFLFLKNSAASKIACVNC